MLIGLGFQILGGMLMTRDEGLTVGCPMGGMELMGLTENPVWSGGWQRHGRPE